MIKYLVASLVIFVFNLSYGETSQGNIVVSPIENLSFQKIAVTQQFNQKILATGYIEIKLEEPLKTEETYSERLLVINYPKEVYLTNTNQTIKIEDIIISEQNFRNLIIEDPTIEKKGIQVRFNGSPLKLEVSAILDRNQINSTLENIEGLYEGNIPLEITQFKKEGVMKRRGR